MRYDDRLATVLRLTPVGAHVARVQYRQLIDLLGSTPADARGELLDAAYLRLAETAASIAPEVRAAMLAEPALRLRSARLVAALAEGEPRVAEAALNAADLTAEEWADLIPALPPLARALAGTRADLPASARALLARLGLGKRALPAAQAQAQAQAPAAPTPAHPVDEIGAIVRRIERFRRHREAQAPAAPADSPRLPLGEAPTALPELRSFDFASDSEGRIVWCEADVAPMIIGLSLGETPGLYTAIRHHQPLRAIPVELAGAAAIAGTWQVDALPRFDPLGGRFIGYLGRFRRPAAGTAPPPPRETGSDRLRQLLHELRTPVNAVQGFAEIIQQQLFGPAPHEYRALAAHIAADSARMLAGFEELERFAKLDSGAMALPAGSGDLFACVAATIARLEPHSTPRASGFQLGAPPAPEADGTPPLAVALAPAELERLVWRLLATLAANAGPGEVLPVELVATGGYKVLAMALPRTLAGLDDHAFYHAQGSTGPEAPFAGMFGTGFALRLASAEARAAGGDLLRQGAALQLRLPGLTAAAAPPSHPARGQAVGAAPAA